MNIAILIKHVPVSNNVSVNPETHALIRESSEGMVNPADLNAIEAALRIIEKTGGKTVVFSMGPPDAEKSLRDALALGCDEGCLITDRVFAGGDTVATSYVISEALKKFGEFDIIISGSMSSDGATGQVGPMTAEFLGIPHVNEASSVEISEDENEVIITKRYEGNEYLISSPMPVLVSINYGSNEARLATLRSKRAAKSKPVTVYTNKDLNLDSSRIGLQGSPTIVIDSYEPEQSKHAEMIEGSISELAEKLRNLISNEKEI